MCACEVILHVEMISLHVLNKKHLGKRKGKRKER